MPASKQTLDKHVTPRIRGPFDRERAAIVFHEESRTHQSFKAECDINTIMGKYERGQLIEHVNRYQGDYGDYTKVPQSYDEALNQVIEAKDMFMTLPAKLREKFDNDPAEFLAFVDNPENLDEMRELGLANPLPSQPGPVGPPAEPASGVDDAPKGKSKQAPRAPDEQKPSE